MTMLPILIHTDGACSGNPGPGAWAYAIDYGAKVIYDQGLHKANTTNNRMELTAAIEALRRIHTHKVNPGRQITLHTDSRYLEQGMNKNLATWKARKWTTYGGRRPVQNQDLWRELDALQRIFKIEWVWVPGHGTEQSFWMEKVDQMAHNLVQEWVKSNPRRTEFGQGACGYVLLLFLVVLVCIIVAACMGWSIPW